jgi:hypothetical protein
VFYIVIQPYLEIGITGISTFFFYISTNVVFQISVTMF